MSVDLEWLQGKTGIIRWGDEFEKYGDPYEFVVIVEMDNDDNSAELKSAVGRISTKGRREIFHILKENGIKKVRWERKNKANPKKIEKET